MDLFPKSSIEVAGDALVEALRGLLPHIRECPGVESARVVPVYELYPGFGSGRGGRCPLVGIDLEIVFSDAIAYRGVGVGEIARHLAGDHPRWGLAHYQGRGKGGDPRFHFAARWIPGGTFRPWEGSKGGTPPQWGWGT